MLYVKETSKSVEQAVADLDASIKRHGFGTLHQYDFKKTLHEKGFDFPNECRVLEICNPGQAAAVLEHNMALNMALPCRVSVYQEAGQTRIGMVRPTALLGLISQSEELRQTAEDVEQTIIQIIDEAT